MSEAIPTDALIVIADGGGATLYRNHGQGTELSLRKEEEFEPKAIAQGPSGSRPEDQSPKQTSEATFAKNLVKTLEGMHSKGAFQALVLVADPQTLGQMREAMHKSLEATVVRSLSKDLTNSPIKDIERSLSHA